MTGKSRNSPAEIQFILELSRQGLSRAQIAAKCNEQWKGRMRSENSVGYVVNKYKEDAKYAPTLAASWNNPAGAYDSDNMISASTSAWRNDAKHRQQHYANQMRQTQPAHQARQLLYQGPQFYQVQTLSQTQRLHQGQQLNYNPAQLGASKPSMNYLDQEEGFSATLGLSLNTSHPTYKMDCSSQLHAENGCPPWVYSDGQQQSIQLPIANKLDISASYPSASRFFTKQNTTEVPTNYSSLSRSDAIQQVTTNGLFPLNVADRKKQFIQLEAMRRYRQLQIQASSQAATHQDSSHRMANPLLQSTPPNKPPAYDPNTTSQSPPAQRPVFRIPLSATHVSYTGSACANGFIQMAPAKAMRSMQICNTKAGQSPPFQSDPARTPHLSYIYQPQASVNSLLPRNTSIPQSGSISKLRTSPEGNETPKKTEQNIAPGSDIIRSIEDRIKAAKAALVTPTASLKNIKGYLYSSEIKKRKAAEDFMKIEKSTKKLKLSLPKEESKKNGFAFTDPATPPAEAFENRWDEQLDEQIMANIRALDQKTPQKTDEEIWLESLADMSPEDQAIELVVGPNLYR